MANWARNHAEVFAGRRVVELGSGTGMLGISLLKASLGMQGGNSMDSVRFSVDSHARTRNAIQ